MYTMPGPSASRSHLFTVGCVLVAQLNGKVATSGMPHLPYNPHKPKDTPPRWTEWYNSYPDTDGDYECLDCITRRGFSVCADSEVLDAQCRVTATGLTFNEETQHDAPDILNNPCTKTGLVCLNRDQRDGHLCTDYGIRFKCAAANNVLKSMYWWIGVLTAVFVIIAIIWFIFYVIRRRRNSRESQDNEDNPDPSLAQPPPAYKDLFPSSDTSSTNELWRNNRNIRSSVSSQNPLVNSEPSSGVDYGIDSPIFSISDEMASNPCRQSIVVSGSQTGPIPYPSPNLVVGTNDSRVIDQIQTSSDEIRAQSDQILNVSDQIPNVSNEIPNISDQTPNISDQIPNDSDQTNVSDQISNETTINTVTTDNEIETTTVEGDNLQPNENRVAPPDGPPPPYLPVLPWQRRRSGVHRSPFPLLQPYHSVEQPPSYREALRYLGLDKHVVTT